MLRTASTSRILPWGERFRRNPVFRGTESFISINLLLKTINIPLAKLISPRKKAEFDEAVLAMASIPVTSFSASKIHDHLKSKYKPEETPNEEAASKTFRHNLFGMNTVLPNYNSKLMNSIWGQYNLYASHAFQKNNEGSNSGVDFLSVPQVKNLWDSTRNAH